MEKSLRAEERADFLSRTGYHGVDFKLPRGRGVPVRFYKVRVIRVSFFGASLLILHSPKNNDNN